MRLYVVGVCAQSLREGGARGCVVAARKRRRAFGDERLRAAVRPVLRRVRREWRGGEREGEQKLCAPKVCRMSHRLLRRGARHRRKEKASGAGRV
jgi:hypothetical protein